MGVCGDVWWTPAVSVDEGFGVAEQYVLVGVAEQ